MQMGLCNIWIVMIVLTREFTVASIRMIAAADGVVIPANIWGKLKTVSQMTFTIVIMLLGEVYSILAAYNPVWYGNMPALARMSIILLWSSAVLTGVSGVIYVIDSKKVIDYTK